MTRIRQTMAAAAAAALAAGCVAGVPGVGGDCRVTAPRDETVGAAGLTEVRVLAGAGSLSIVGDPSIDEIRIGGEACAPRPRDLERLDVTTRRTGGDLLIEAPTGDVRRGRIDLTITLPARLPIGITDGSGSLVVSGVAAVAIDDGPGSVEVRDVAGDVRVRDGSGGLDVRGVGGSVVVELDGSGGITVRDVGGDVRVEQDGSGGIDVRDVAGDLSVGPDGSGGVNWRRVAGRVTTRRD